MENVYTEFHKNSTNSSVVNSKSQRLTPSRIRPPHQVFFFTSSRKLNHEDYSLKAAMCRGHCVNLASCVEQPDLPSFVISYVLQFSVTFVVVSCLVTCNSPVDTELSLIILPPFHIRSGGRARFSKTLFSSYKSIRRPVLHEQSPRLSNV
jgi:hypothetical protein